MSSNIGELGVESAAAAQGVPGASLTKAVPFAIIALVAFASRMVWFGDPAADFDEQLYSLIGARLLDGQLPYADLWDRKPFGLFALFALAHAIGGAGPLAYQVMAALFVSAGGALIYALARPLADRVTACGAAILYPLLAYAYGAYSGQSEVFFIPLVLGALLLVRDLDGDNAELRAAGAMLLGGLALQIKYTVAPQCAFLGCVALGHFRSEPPLRLALRAAVYALIGLLPTLAVAGFYAAAGEFDAFFYANFVSIFERLPAPGGRLDPRFVGPLAPLALLAAGGFYAALRLNRPRDPRSYRLIAGYGATVIAGIFLPGTVYIYYFVAFVPCAILLALPLLDRTAALRWAPLALVLGGSAALLNVPRHYADTAASRAGIAELARAIAPHVGAERDCLLVYDGPTALYPMTGSCLPGRIVYPDHLNNALETPALGLDQTGEVARILAARPGAIVTADKPVTEQNRASGRLIAEAIAAHYRPLATAVVRERTYRAWARRD
jgi:hypothetical protein